ncbi:hypothetical protein C3L33_08704, partial [Rhododendron williamsianum]
MSSDAPNQPKPEEDGANNDATQSKKAAKKEAAKQQKRAAAAAAAAVTAISIDPPTPSRPTTATSPWRSSSRRPSRAASGPSLGMVKFATGLNRESYVDVEGTVSVPNSPIKGASQQVEIQVRKVYCISKAVPTLPINIEDAARSELEIDKALQAGEQLVRVNQDTRLNFRVLDLRTPSNQGIFRVQCQVENIFRQFLLSEGFVGIHTPKLIAGSSEGGSAVFRLDYKGQPACLAQSPQLHKQMAICGDFGRVFEVGPVFRAEDSFTHRHLCEFTGLDVEMEIKEHYSEVMDIVDRLFVALFDSLNERCQKELEAIGKQYPFEPLKNVHVLNVYCISKLVAS